VIQSCFALKYIIPKEKAQKLSIDQMQGKLSPERFAETWECRAREQLKRTQAAEALLATVAQALDALIPYVERSVADDLAAVRALIPQEAGEALRSAGSS